MQDINYFTVTKSMNLDTDTAQMNKEVKNLNLSLDKILSIIDRESYFIVFYKDYTE